MIGTLTVHYNSNYGANLQAYALRMFLQTKTEEEVKVIDYRNDMIRNLYALRPWDVHKSFPYVTMNLGSIKRFIKMLLNIEGTVIRDSCFNRFRNRYIPMTRTVYDVKSICNLRCSLVMIGSDQIWNDDITRDKEKAFWGSMKSPKTTVVSYAPSFGRTEISELENENIQDNIHNFDYITVREQSMIGLLNPYTDKKIHVVCDPALLLTQEEWKNLITPKREKYVFVYILQNNSDLIEMAEKAAKILGLKIIIVSSGMRIVPHSGNYYKSVDPCGFLSYLYYAEYVFTNSFHGTVFSVLFNKKFVTLPDTKKPARMLEFLGKCGLSGRIVYHAEDVSDKYLQEEIDYSSAHKYITDLRSRSILCIEDMLKLKEQNDG